MSSTLSSDATTTRTKHRPLLVALVVILIVAVGGVAFAYWTSSGTGTGEAQTGTSSALEVEGGETTDAALTPGGPSQSIPFTVTNTSSGTQDFSSVVVTVANADGSAWTAVPGCSAADYSVGTPVVTYGPIDGEGTRSGTVSLSMVNRPVNQDACKTVTVPLRFVVS
jgi:hypothetical protein